MARKNSKKPRTSAPRAPLTADFIIPGFPKCSTSALARFLERSPACHLSKLPNSYESPYFMESTQTPDPEYAPGLKNGHKFAAYIYSRPALTKAYHDNPNTLFIISVRPALPALLSWRKMHARMAETGVPGHFTTRDDETRRFYTSASPDEYFEAFANRRLDYADHIESFQKSCPGARFVVISQARLSEDAEGSLSHIHHLLGVTAQQEYLDALPRSHAATGDREASSVEVGADTVKALRQKDERLRALLASLDDEQKLVSTNQLF
jgi:hypothetical protein